MIYIAIGMILYGCFAAFSVLYLSRRQALRQKAIEEYQRTGVRSEEYIRLYREDKT